MEEKDGGLLGDVLNPGTEAGIADEEDPAGRAEAPPRPIFTLLGDEPAATLTRSSKFDLMAQLQNVVLQGHVDAFNRLVFVLGHLEKQNKKNNYCFTHRNFTLSDIEHIPSNH